MMTHTLVLSAGQLFAKALSMAWTFYLARRLGVDIFGRWAGILAFASIFSALRDFGSLNLLIRDISQDRGRVRYYFGNSVLLYLGLCAVAMSALVLSGFVLHYPGEKIWLLVLAGFGFVSAAPMLAAQAALYGTEQFTTYTLLSGFGTLAYVGFGFILVEMDYSVRGALFALCLGNAVSSVFLYRAVVSEHGSPEWEVDPGLWRGLLKAGGILTLGTLMNEIATRSDRLIIEKFWDEASVGFYQAAFVLAYIPREVLLIPLIGAFYPRLSQDYASDRVRFGKTLERMNFVALLCTLPAVFIPFSIAPQLLILAYGHSYLGADRALTLLFAALPFIFLSGIWNQIFLVRKKEYQFMAATGLLMAATLLLNFLLVPRRGFVGSSLAFLYSQIAYSALVAYWVKDDLTFLPVKRFGGLLLAAIAGWFGASLFRGSGLWLPVAAAFFNYGACLYLFRVIAPEEWNWARSKILFWIR